MSHTSFWPWISPLAHAGITLPILFYFLSLFLFVGNFLSFHDIIIVFDCLFPLFKLLCIYSISFYVHL